MKVEDNFIALHCELRQTWSMMLQPRRRQSEEASIDVEGVLGISPSLDTRAILNVVSYIYTPHRCAGWSPPGSYQLRRISRQRRVGSGSTWLVRCPRMALLENSKYDTSLDPKGLSGITYSDFRHSP